MLQPRIVGEEHYETAQRVKQTSQRYKELKKEQRGIIAIDRTNSPNRRRPARARAFLITFFVAEVLTAC